MTFRLVHGSYSLPEGGVSLKYPYSLLPLFSMPLKLLILHGEANFLNALLLVNMSLKV